MSRHLFTTGALQKSINVDVTRLKKSIHADIQLATNGMHYISVKLLPTLTSIGQRYDL